MSEIELYEYDDELAPITQDEETAVYPANYYPAGQGRDKYFWERFNLWQALIGYVVLAFVLFAVAWLLLSRLLGFDAVDALIMVIKWAVGAP